MISPKEMKKRFFTRRAYNTCIECGEHLMSTKIWVEDTKNKLGKLQGYFEKSEFPEPLCFSLGLYASEIKNRWERLDETVKCDISRIEDLLTMIRNLRQINEWYQGEEREKEIRTLIKAFNRREDERSGLLDDVPRRTKGEDEI